MLKINKNLKTKSIFAQKYFWLSDRRRRAENNASRAWSIEHGAAVLNNK